MKNALRTAGLLVATAAASTALVGAAATSASAAPTGCSTGGGNTWADAYCSGGTGYYQVYAVCRNDFIPGASQYWFVESNWVKARSGERPSVQCWSGGGVVQSRGVGLRN